MLNGQIIKALEIICYSLALRVLEVHMIKRLILSGVVLLLSGCASFPEPVQLPPDSPTITYEQAAMDIEGNTGKFAQWGGVIASIENQSEKTLLEVVYHPLRGYGRPLLNRESVGRFRVYVNGFLDPMVYQRGRTVTFSGTLAGLEEGMVGEHKYFYPTLAAKGYYLWEDVERIDVSSFSVWPIGIQGGWRHPWYGRWYGNWFPYNHTRTIIRRRRDYYHDYGNQPPQSGNGQQQEQRDNGQRHNNGKNSNGKKHNNSNKDIRPALKKAAKDGKNIP